MKLEVRKKLILELLEKQRKRLGIFEELIPSGLAILAFLGIGGIGGISVGGLAKIGLSGIKEFSRQSLSKGQQDRIDLVIENAYKKIADRILSGEKLRDDDFINASGKESKADQIFRAILDIAKGEIEGYKLHHLSEFFSNLVFLKNFDIDEILRFLKVFNDLSYRQLILIKLLHDNRENKFLLRTERYSEEDNYDYKVISVNQELIELYVLELVIRNDYKPRRTILMKYWHQIVPAKMVLTNIGLEFFESFDIGAIEDGKLDKNIAILKI